MIATTRSLPLEIWTFPKVTPAVFTSGSGLPGNPFGLPNDVLLITPPTQVFFPLGSGPDLYQNYLNYYVATFKFVNSPRMKTNLTCVFRNALPQPGDQLVIDGGVQYPACGMIKSVSLSYSASGVSLSVNAEAYDCKNQATAYYRQPR
jgi:hypothetical protein